jgi:hypothetical protein
VLVLNRERHLYSGETFETNFSMMLSPRLEPRAAFAE